MRQASPATCSAPYRRRISRAAARRVTKFRLASTYDDRSGDRLRRDGAGQEHLDGVDLRAEEFYAQMATGASVSTATPPPGAFVAVYERAREQGATAVLSMHTGSAYSATVSSAQLAAQMVEIPVSIDGTGVASFPVSMAP